MAAHHPLASVTDEAMESLPTEMPLNRSQPKWLKALTGRWYNPADIALVYLAKAVPLYPPPAQPRSALERHLRQTYW